MPRTNTTYSAWYRDVNDTAVEAQEAVDSLPEITTGAEMKEAKRRMDMALDGRAPDPSMPLTERDAEMDRAHEVERRLAAQEKAPPFKITPGMG